MRNLLVAGLAAGLIAAGAPAQAHPNYHYTGHCGETDWTGEIHAVFVATDAGTGSWARVQTDVECRVNGAVVASGSSAHGIVVLFHPPVPPGSEICEYVTVGGEYHATCGVQPLPPTARVDAVVCPALRTTRPRLLPVLDTQPDGDVYVLGQLTWDCPPYQT